MCANEEILKQLQQEDEQEAAQRAQREQRDAEVAAMLMQQEEFEIQRRMAARKAREAQVCPSSQCRLAVDAALQHGLHWQVFLWARRANNRPAIF